MSLRLVKLVRSRVGRTDDKVPYVPIPREERTHALMKKLSEEVAEYLLEGTIDELADVYETVRVLALLRHGSYSAVVERADRKCEVRGGLLQGLGMYIEGDLR